MDGSAMLGNRGRLSSPVSVTTTAFPGCSPVHFLNLGYFPSISPPPGRLHDTQELVMIRIINASSLESLGRLLPHTIDRPSTA